MFKFKTYKSKRDCIINILKKEIKTYIEDINRTKTIISEQKTIKNEIEFRTQKIKDFFNQYGYVCNEI